MIIALSMIGVPACFFLVYVLVKLHLELTRSARPALRSLTAQNLGVALNRGTLYMVRPMSRPVR